MSHFTKKVERVKRINGAMVDSFALCEFAGKTEAEVMIFQTLRACAVNLRKHGGIFGFKSKKLRVITGGGLGDNPAGYQILLDRRWIEEKSLAPGYEPEGTEIEDGRPVGIFPTDELLFDLERHLEIAGEGGEVNEP